MTTIAMFTYFPHKILDNGDIFYLQGLNNSENIQFEIQYEYITTRRKCSQML